METTVLGFTMKQLDNIGKILDFIGFGSIVAVFMILILGAASF